jgi:hypothetical protein
MRTNLLSGTAAFQRGHLYKYSDGALPEQEIAKM